MKVIENIKTGLKTFFLSLLVLLVFLGLFEFSARVVLSIKKGDSLLLFYGFVEKPKRLQAVVGRDGIKYVKSTPSQNRRNPVNKLGFRGPEVKKDKKPGTCRIVCLGGSTTHGARLDYKDIYPTLLQRRLDKLFGVGNYEIINAGQPGLDLKQINSLARDNVLKLMPDIVLVLSINNNFKAPGFFYVGIDNSTSKDKLKSDMGKSRYFIMRLRNFLVDDIAAALLLEEYVNLKKNPVDLVDWGSFSDSLLSIENIWESEYKKQLDALLSMFSESNPDVQIVLIEQAVNTNKYPMMALPFERAKDILREKAKKNSWVFTLDTHSKIIEAAVSQSPVWQQPDFDPLHLSRTGNEVLSQVIADYFMRSPYLQQCHNKKSPLVLK